MFISKFIEGSEIYLRPLLEEDADGSYPEWLNDAEVCQGNSHQLYPYSKKNAYEYIGHVNASNKDLVLAISLKEKNLHIGNISLQKINPVYRTAEFAILLGDKTQWGKGYGFEAGKLIIDHGFKAFNLNRIECATFESNVGMIKLALALGMKKEGTKRHAAYKNGKYLDIIQFGLLRDEFNF